MATAISQFNYLQWKPSFEVEKPYCLYTDPPPGYPNANFATRPGPSEVIHDVRGQEDAFNLDDHAFAFAKQIYPGSLHDLNEETVKSEYYPSLEGKLREVLREDAEIF
jgi:hypothetical protein